MIIVHKKTITFKLSIRFITYEIPILSTIFAQDAGCYTKQLWRNRGTKRCKFLDELFLVCSTYGTKEKNVKTMCLNVIWLGFD
jgi:hypothetical protein